MLCVCVPAFVYCFSLGIAVPNMMHTPTRQGKERAHYDVICVGCGPAGSTFGYYMGKKGRKVLILEKATFPRDKICGDALCKTGIEIIHEMGVYEELKKENKMNIVSYPSLCLWCGCGISFA